MGDAVRPALLKEHAMPTSSSPLPRLLTLREVADALRLKPNTIAARESRGIPLLPKVKIGGATRYRESDVHALILSRVAGTAGARP